MATKTHDILADVGSYKTADGTEKKRWVKVGALFDNMSMKLDAVPISPDWSGWLTCKVPTPFETQKAPQPQWSDSEPPF